MESTELIKVIEKARELRAAQKRAKRRMSMDIRLAEKLEAEFDATLLHLEKNNVLKPLLTEQQGLF